MNKILNKFNIKTIHVSKSDLTDSFIKLVPDEAVNSYGIARKESFLLGRLASWKLLEELKITPQIILNDRDGVPIFPREIKGSISHKKDKAVCAGTNDKNILSLGIDIEKEKNVPQELLSRIGTDFEQKALFNQSSESILSLFSLKEAIYKAVFPIIRRPLYFRDAEVDLSGDPKIRVLNAPEISLKSIHLASLSIDGYILTYCIVTKP